MQSMVIEKTFAPTLVAICLKCVMCSDLMDISDSRLVAWNTSFYHPFGMSAIIIRGTSVFVYLTTAIDKNLIFNNKTQFNMFAAAIACIHSFSLCRNKVLLRDCCRTFSLTNPPKIHKILCLKILVFFKGSNIKNKFNNSLHGCLLHM